MRLFWLEVRKIISSPAIWGFLLICMAFNIFLAYGNSVNYRETAEPENVFNGYETAHIAEAYIKGMRLEGKLADTMHEKYAALQPVVEQKAQNKDSLGQYTKWQHEGIFNKVLMPLLFEGIIIASLIMLLTLGHENINHTEGIVYSSKTGRRIVWYKKAAAVAVTFGVFAFLSLTAFTALHISYADLWGHNVSSAFNYFYDIIAGPRPFATWRSFTVLGYLWAVIGVSFCVVLCFSLAAFAVGTTIRNSYAAFVAIFLGTVFVVFLAMILPVGYIKFSFIYTPIWLALKLPVWFTDGGGDILWRNFESVGTLVSIILLLGLAVLAAYKHKRRDLL